MTLLDTQQPEYIGELISSQVNFGLAYIQEARTAYDEGRIEYGDLARQIALNAYSTANRFAARLPQPQDTTLLETLADFKQEVDLLLEIQIAVPSIA